ncbi:hypothetical protein EVJ58_g1802 [Rhodofomes roseus]|uniref:Major facilitator superfamily (MFS) profile domain-containing protein n=1 Tax=Rhodofomes roseus TaxID=34475 RepID=A0A4Y9YX58_9APHY|nr:hypothetical protein EVJ58_g1802 [Rhodofomes roseus]
MSDDAEKQTTREAISAVPALDTRATRDPEDSKMSKKARLSAYFTIAAAAFGLISDGSSEDLIFGICSRVATADEYHTGEIIGQVFVGLICDRIGRKAALVITTLLIVIGAILATAAHGAHGSVSGLLWFVAIARGITGVGVGGEYPASSTSASEAANEKMAKNRGPVFIMVTNFVLSFGGPLAVCVFLIVLSAAGEDHLETVWRVCFGIGVLLPLTVFYFRMRMLSPKLFRESAIKHRVPYWLAIKRYWRPLIGTCGAWFLYDFVTFPNGVFSGTIISSVIHDGSIRSTAEWQLLLGAIALPGTSPFLNSLSRGPCVVHIMEDFVHQSYPTAIRGTCYGLSAAIGKTGAAIGTQAFTPIENNLGKRWTFIIAAICGVAGVLVTYFFVPDLTGADLADEDVKWLRYLAENGWNGEVGDEGDEEALAEKISAGKEGDSVDEKA